MDPGHRGAARHDAPTGTAAHASTCAAATRSARRGRDPPGHSGRGLGAGRPPPGRLGVAGRAVASPAASRGAPRADLHQAGPDHLERRGAVPVRAGRGVQDLPRPGARRGLRLGATCGRTGPRATARRGLRALRRGAARRGVDRPGARRTAAQRRRHPRSRGRGEGATADHPHPGAPRPGGHVVAGTVPGRPDPRRRAREPAGARRALRRDDQRGARLPARGREHARRRRVVRTARSARPDHRPTASRPGDTPGPGHGASRRVRLRRPRIHAGRWHRHPRDPPHRHDRVHRGLHGARHLPRGPARRQPVRHLRRAHRAARLRHHGPDDRPGARPPSSGS